MAIPKYTIYLYNNNDILIGEILNIENITYTEKDNDFSEVKVSLTTNNLETDIYDGLQPLCKIRIFREDRLIFTGIAPQAPEQIVDGSNVETYNINFEHVGKYFANRAQIQKNYTSLMDEGVIAGDIVLFAQNPTNYNAMLSSTFTQIQVDYFIDNLIIEETGTLTTFDFTKRTTVANALKQVCELDSDKKKFFKFSPHLKNQDEGTFEFFSLIPYYTDIVFSGQKNQGLTSSNVFQNIISLKRSSSPVANVIIAQGDGITTTVIGSQSSLNTYKVIIKQVDFKNINQPAKLESLALKELQKSQNPKDIITVDIVENDPSIGQFGVGDYVKIDWIDSKSTQKSINDFYRVYELSISINGQGVEKMSLLLAQEDFDVNSLNWATKMIHSIKKNKETVEFLSRN